MGTDEPEDYRDLTVRMAEAFGRWMKASASPERTTVPSGKTGFDAGPIFVDEPFVRGWYAPPDDMLAARLLSEQPGMIPLDGTGMSYRRDGDGGYWLVDAGPSDEEVMSPIVCEAMLAEGIGTPAQLHLDLTASILCKRERARHGK